MKRFYTLLLIVSLFSFSCSSDDDGNPTMENINNGGSTQVAGDWEGTFSGTDSGTWEIIIDDNGTVTGTAFSNTFSQTLVVAGVVNDRGEFEATVGAASSGAVFTGTFKDGKGSGTWVNVSQNLSGDWVGSKQ